MPSPSFGLLAQSLLYIASGINHFWHTDFYLDIMPDHYSNQEFMVKLSGVTEVMGGAGLLVPATRRPAAVGLAAMLVVFLDVHLFMLRHPDWFPKVPKWALWARLPMQALLIAWALRYARKDRLRPKLQD